jgi:NDP-sugar pyrophosphorylase family protein
MLYAILAAGEGSRLAQEGCEVPKPLVRIQGETLIGRLIEEEATLGNLNAVSTLAQGNIGLLEVKIREFRTAGLSPMTGALLYDEVDYPDEALPIAVVHDGTPQLVDEETRVVPGDTVIVATPTELIPEVRTAFRFI